MRAMEEAGLVVDRYGAGAFMAAMGAATWRSDDVQARCEEELVRRSPFNDYTLPRVALIRSRKARRMLERLFGTMLIEELPRPLFTITADLVSIDRRGSVLDAVGASMSIPGLAPPVRLAGRLLVDGAVLRAAGRRDGGVGRGPDPGGWTSADGSRAASAPARGGCPRLSRICFPRDAPLQHRALGAQPDARDRPRPARHRRDRPARVRGARMRAVQAGYEAASRVLEGGGADVLRAATSAPVA